MKRVIILIVAAMALSAVRAQVTMDEALAAIEENNTTLRAYRKAVEAEKCGNRTGLALPDPEVGVNCLWGSPSEIGRRTDISVTQTFDIPTLSGAKRRLADRKDESAEWQYRIERMGVLLEAKQCLLDIAYYNGLLKELAVRRQNAQAILEAQKKRLDEGDGNVLEYNNVRLDLSKVLGEIRRVETERAVAGTQLARLNGGKPLAVGADGFAPACPPQDFEQWYRQAEQRSPVIAYLGSNVEAGRRQVALSKAMSLPTFSVGYMSEKTVGERYQGISLGVSIPLWGNRNAVRQATKAVEAAEAQRADAASQLHGQLKALHQRAVGLYETARIYRDALEGSNSTALLRKALDAGEVSVLEYLTQSAIYYDSIDKALSAELDCQKALAELSAYEL